MLAEGFPVYFPSMVLAGPALLLCLLWTLYSAVEFTCVHYFFRYCDQISDRRNIKEKGIILALEVTISHSEEARTSPHRRLRQEGWDFEVSLGYTGRH